MIGLNFPKQQGVIMSTKPMKPITKPGEGKERQKHVTQERYLKERYQISLGLKGPKRLERNWRDSMNYRFFTITGCIVLPIKNPKINATKINKLLRYRIFIL